MSTATHTPGPWEIVKAERLSHDAPEIGPNVSDGGILGGSPDDPVWIVEGEIDFAPDAHLIAAAPDLLGALRFILAFYEPGQTYLDTNAWKQAEALARAAVAKAEGRS